MSSPVDSSGPWHFTAPRRTAFPRPHLIMLALVLFWIFGNRLGIEVGRMAISFTESSR